MCNVSTPGKGILYRQKYWNMVVVLTLSILLLNSHFLFGAGLVEDGGKLESFPCRGIYESYEKFSKYVWPLIDFCVYFAIPFAFFVTGNVLIIKKLALARRERQMLQNRKTCRQNLQSKNGTALLLSICAMFLITLAPVTLFYWLSSLDRTRSSRWSTFHFGLLLRTV